MEKDQLKECIVYEDHRLLIVNKPFALPVQNDHSKDVNLLQLSETYCDQKLHLLNRLDRPVSGIVVMIKDTNYYAEASAQWQEDAQKSYLAITEGKWSEKSGTLENMLKKGRNNKAIEHKSGKSSRLKYKVVHEFDRFTLLKIELITGRFHQIRAQLSLAGHPIKGDVKYGARRKNKERNIHLHCFEVSLGSHNFRAEPPVTDTLWQETAEIISEKNKSTKKS